MASGVGHLSALLTILVRQKACNEAFHFICTYIEDNVIGLETVERMTVLRDIYFSYLEDNFIVLYNQGYQTHKLREKLVLRFGARFIFHSPTYRNQLMLSVGLNTGDATACCNWSMYIRKKNSSRCSNHTNKPHSEVSLSCS